MQKDNKVLDVAGKWRSRRSLRAGESALPGTRIGELEAEVGEALDRDEIAVLFQPQYDCASGAVVGAEALARWEHSRLGQIGGDALFAIAGRAGREVELSRHIAQVALTAAASWPKHLRLSLNVTAADLAAEDFADWVMGAVARASILPAQVVLEITEQALVLEIERSAERLERLSDHGIGIALDDFGAGFCNFRYLKRLPLCALKLDRSMIEGITHDARDLAVLRGIIALAHALELYVVAEGVESQAMLEAVRREGCEVWQGFLGSRPMGAEEFSRL